MKGVAPKKAAAPTTDVAAPTPATVANTMKTSTSRARQPQSPVATAKKKKSRLGKGAPNPISFAITAIVVIGVAYYCATYSLSTLVPLLKDNFGNKRDGTTTNNNNNNRMKRSNNNNNAPHEYSDDGYFGATTNPSEFTQIVPQKAVPNNMKGKVTAADGVEDGGASISDTHMPTTTNSNVFIQNMTALGAVCPGLKPKSERKDVEDMFTHCVPPVRRCSRAVVDFPMLIEKSPSPEHENDAAIGSSRVFAHPDDIPEATPQEVHLMAQKTLSSQNSGNHRHYYDPSNVRDRIVSLMEHVLDTVGRGGGAGPVSLVELNRGVYSIGEKFASLPLTIVNAVKRDKLTPRPVTVENLAFMWSVFKSVERHVSEFLFCESYPCATSTEQNAAQETGAKTLYLASPSFFSKIVAGKPPKNDNDEYWHLHIDRLQYGSFAVTSLLYLDDISEVGSKMYNPNNGDDEIDSEGEEEECVNGKDFSGGGFVFEGDVKAVVHPAIGRLSMFTSSSENPHYVDRVRCGVRRAVTIAFTCNAEVGIKMGDSYEDSPLFKVVQDALQFDPDTQDVEFG